MKKEYLLIVSMLLCTIASQAQQKVSKPPINNDSYKKWKSLGHYNISNDGKYAWYKSGSLSSPQSLVVCATNGKFKRELPVLNKAKFTPDSKRLVFDSPKGLAILQMAKDSVQYVEAASEFSMPEEGDGRWLSFRKESDIILKDLASGKEKTYLHANGAWFNDKGSVFLVQTSTTLLRVTLPDEKETAITHSNPTSSITFDAAGTGIGFITSGPQGNVLRYYQPGLDSAIILTAANSDGICKACIISDDAPQFSGDGQHMFFKLAAPDPVASISHDSAVITKKVDVWNYKDKYLMSEQMELLPELDNRTYTATVTVHTGKVIQLESDEIMLNWPLNNKPGSKYILASNIINEQETYWNKIDAPSYKLISLLDGSSKKILSVSYPHTAFFCGISPREQFVTWYDQKEKNYFSYEVSTGVTRNITQGIKVQFYKDDDYQSTVYGFPFGIAGWLPGDNALLIYDKYDIWKVDPTNKKLPVNITAGYGRIHKIVFRVVGDDLSPVTTDTLLLAALDEHTKYNGFWKKQWRTAAAPTRCGNMSASLCYFPNIGGIDLSVQPPVKAKNAPVYLVQRMSAKDAPNLFATADFSSFAAVSEIQPQKEYNWMTSELIHWKMLDGHIAEGILYKPENFDPKKKYPLVFYYYEKFSNYLFTFKKPALSAGMLNIPWYVSNGYIVCVPNIYYTTGHTGMSAVNSVVSAAKYLSAFPWVDGKKMGIQGHSFGGYETNYLVSHSTIFAAAQGSAGLSDMIGSYGAISFGGKSTAFMSEIGQNGLDATPWQRPDIFVENSPVFSADKVATPLLIMHNKKDEAVPFSQDVEMFLALRRLQKPVWMLQYDDGGHILGGDASKRDFTIRQEQFFDHYLKGAPAPVWMVEGVPAKYKGIKSGLALSGQWQSESAPCHRIKTRFKPKK